MKISFANEHSTKNTSRNGLEEFIAVGYDDGSTATIRADKDILEVVQSLKNIIDADSNDENEVNKAAPAATSFKMRHHLGRVYIEEVDLTILAPHDAAAVVSRETEGGNGSRVTIQAVDVRSRGQRAHVHRVVSAGEQQEGRVPRDIHVGDGRAQVYGVEQAEVL
ncbi:hypothetical protein TNCV_4950611 [Trichonephila clavipes]|nr:hypothetical protein TNCV_4950611 [Trichonephila clavipes]